MGDEVNSILTTGRAGVSIPEVEQHDHKNSPGQLMPEETNRSDENGTRGSQIVVDAELERLLITSFASNDELVEALTNLRAYCLLTPDESAKSLDVITRADTALMNALKGREAS